MSRWFRMYDDLVDDPKVQRLPADLFKTQFMAAIKGEQSVFGRYIKAFNGRLAPKEWAALIKTIYQRDNYTCLYCGDRAARLECDHVIPVSRGGDHSPANLKTACRSCNRKKGKKLLSEWRTV